MALEDLTVSVGLVTHGEDQLDDLINKLLKLDTVADNVDPIEIDVAVDSDDALAEIAALKSASDDIDGESIDVPTVDPSFTDLADQFGGVDPADTPAGDLFQTGGEPIAMPGGGIPDGGITTDGGDINMGIPDGGETSPMDSLSVDQIRAIEQQLMGAEEQFDPRGLLNEEITTQDLIEGTDKPIFDVRGIETDDLIDTGRTDTPPEQLIPFDELRDRLGIDQFAELVAPDARFREQAQNIAAAEGIDIGDDVSFGSEQSGWNVRDVRQTPEESFVDRSLPRRTGDLIFGIDPHTREREGMFGGLVQLPTDISMSDLYNALAKVIPVLLTFVGAIPAAITALAGLATAAVAAGGALLAVGGLALAGGALALGEGNMTAGFKELRKILKNDIMPVVRTLGRMFDDLFFDMLNGFEEFMQSIGRHATVLTRLKDDVRSLAGFVIDVVPPALAMLVRLGDAFMPLFAMFGEWLQMNFDNLLIGLVTATRRALPLVASLAQSFIQILPLVFNLSMGFLYVATAITNLLGMFANFLQWLGPIGTAIGVLIGGLLTFVTLGYLATTVYLALAGTLGGALLSAIGSAITALWTYATSSVTAAVATATLSVAVLGLISVLTIGLAPIIGSLAGGFLGLSGNISKATKSLKNFENMRGGLSGQGLGVGGGMSPTGGLPQGATNVYQDNSSSKVVLPDDASQSDARRAMRRQNYRNSQFRNY